MIRVFGFWACLLVAVPAWGAVSKQTTGPWFLVVSSTPQYPSYVTYDECSAARAARITRDGPGKTSGKTSYYCREGIEATFGPNPPPAPVCTAPRPAADTRTQTCTAPLIGTYGQMREYLSAAYPQCWVAGNWANVDDPAQVCLQPPPPPPDGAVSNLAITCSVGVEIGAPPEACDWSQQVFQRVTPDSYVRACLTAGCNWESGLTWQRFGDVPAVGGVDVCRIAKRPGDPVADGFCEADGAGWGSMGQVRPADVAKGTVQPPPPPPPPPSGTARLNWVPPVANLDDSPLTDLVGFRIFYGQSPDALTQSVQIDSASVATYFLDQLPAGTWYFAMSAFTAKDAESPLTPPVSKTIVR